MYFNTFYYQYILDSGIWTLKGFTQYQCGIQFVQRISSFNMVSSTWIGSKFTAIEVDW